MLAFAPIVMNARTGAIINIETGVQGGDQIGYGVGSPYFGTANGAIGGDHAARRQRSSARAYRRSRESAR
jgi:hypothetical protein